VALSPQAMQLSSQIDHQKRGGENMRNLKLERLAHICGGRRAAALAEAAAAPPAATATCMRICRFSGCISPSVSLRAGGFDSATKLLARE